jgi:hypothetical protein
MSLRKIDVTPRCCTWREITTLRPTDFTEYPYFRFFLISGIAVTPQCCTLKKNHYPQAFGFCWISLFQVFSLSQEFVEYPFFRFLLISGIVVTPQCRILKKNHHPQAYRFHWISLFLGSIIPIGEPDKLLWPSCRRIFPENLQFTGEEIGYDFSADLLGRPFTNRLVWKNVKLPFSWFGDQNLVVGKQ